MDYYTYIISNRWRETVVRLAELVAHGFRSRICNASNAEAQLQVHHLTHERLSREQIGDLTEARRLLEQHNGPVEVFFESEKG